MSRVYLAYIPREDGTVPWNPSQAQTREDFRNDREALRWAAEKFGLRVVVSVGENPGDLLRGRGTLILG